MKSFWEIPGPNKAPHEPCIAFYKYDGQNFRAEWSRKSGWYKFGSRNILIDHTSSMGGAIDVFLRTYGDEIARVFVNNKMFRGLQRAVVFCEYFGPNSFAGVHVEGDPMEVVLFDVALDKQGILIPRDFLNAFGHLRISEVIYQGNFGPQFIQDIREGKYPVKEGVVAKGVLQCRRGKEAHGLWMAKCKTQWWLDELTRRARENSRYVKDLEDNIKEQGNG